jgi:hypothetical protein
MSLLNLANELELGEENIEGKNKSRRVYLN